MTNFVQNWKNLEALIGIGSINDNARFSFKFHRFNDVKSDEE